MVDTTQAEKNRIGDTVSREAQKKYLSFMRHELRTPINAIIGYSEMLMEDAADSKFELLIACLERVHEAGKQLLALVNDWLDQAKVESGQADLHSEAFRIKLREVLRPWTQMAVAAATDAIREATNSNQLNLLPDLERINSAANRFITLAEELTADDQTRFATEVSASVREGQTRHGPLLRTPEVSQKAESTQPGLILVVDDDEANRDMLSRRLVMQGHTIVRAENGRQALELVKKTAFDLVLLDLMMPDVDGYQVLRQLKADEETKDIPVIMISAMDEIDSVVRCIEMGAEDYLPKPFNPVLLTARLNNSLEKKRLRDEQKRLFRTFATSEVADELMARGFSLGGTTVHATVMFTDIRNFTTIAEALSPEDAIQLLNNYYAIMFEVTAAHSGTVSLIQGDGLMIIFGAPLAKPNHCDLAVHAALDMQARLEDFNAHPFLPNQAPIRIGIGIASGIMVVGYAGTRERATYTCIGDTVNLASRLEQHTKVAHMPILIDESTQSEVGADIVTEPLGEVMFKGKTQPINVYAVRMH